MQKYSLPLLLSLLLSHNALGDNLSRRNGPCPCERIGRVFYKPYQIASLSWYGDKTDVPEDIVSILKAHENELIELSNYFSKQGIAVDGQGVREMAWLPGYFIKYDIQRYKNANRLKLFIEKNGLDNMAVAQKYLYHVPNKSFYLSSDNYLVIAKKALGEHSGWSSLNDLQREQLLKVMRELPHNDLLSAKNFLVVKDEKVTIIDTDSWAMESRF